MKKTGLFIILGFMSLSVFAGGDHHHHGVMKKDQFIDQLAKIHACVQKEKMSKDEAEKIIFPHANAYALEHYSEIEQREIKGRSQTQSKKVFIHMGWACEAARNKLMSLKLSEKKD